MATTNLYAAGWRQGSIFTASLPLISLGRLAATRRPRWRLFRPRVAASTQGEVCTTSHSKWVVASQDCDLAGSPWDSDDTLVEIRPVLVEDPPDDWGIRNRRLRLNTTDFVDAASSRMFVTSELLASFASEREVPLDEGRALAFKSWLGLRYDRPAVPDDLRSAATEVAKRCSSRSGRDKAHDVHDVLMQFNPDSDPPEVLLFAVVTDDADQEQVRLWLGEASTRMRREIVVVSGIDVGTRAEASLELLERSYSADISQLTWSGEDPVGAV